MSNKKSEMKPEKIAQVELDFINLWLKEHYGQDSFTGASIWRVVWSDDQLEKRLGTFEDRTESGTFIRRVTEVREVPKYKQWIQQRYILERLVAVPDYQVEELAGKKISYEPIFTFGINGYLPPKIEVAEIVIDSIYLAQYGPKGSALKQKWLSEDPELNPEAANEAKKKRIEALVDYFWGDSSGLGGTTISGESIIVPNSYQRERERSN